MIGVVCVVASLVPGLFSVSLLWLIPHTARSLGGSADAIVVVTDLHVMGFDVSERWIPFTGYCAAALSVLLLLSGIILLSERRDSDAERESMRP